jgi:hypothetical protein
MPQIYHVGDLLPNGATVTADSFVTLPDGSTVEDVHDSKGNEQVITIPGPGSPVANALTIQQRVQANLATLETWISNNPTGAVLTGPQTLVLAKMLVGLCRLLLAENQTVGGS